MRWTRFALLSLAVALAPACDDRANHEEDAVPPTPTAPEPPAPAPGGPAAATSAPHGPPTTHAEAASLPTAPAALDAHAHHGSGMGHHPMPPGMDHPGGMHHDFSNAELWAEVFDDPARDAWQQPEVVVGLMGVAPGMTVADIGTGTGYFVPHLSAAVGAQGRVLALDIEPTLIAHVQQRAAEEGLENVTARVVAPDDPQLEPGSVDRILIVDTWHHIDNRDQYSRHLFDALRPGGAVYVVDYTRESDMGPPPEHRLSPEAVVAELQAGGLVGEVLQESLEKQYVVVGRRP